MPARPWLHFDERLAPRRPGTSAVWPVALAAALSLLGSAGLPAAASESAGPAEPPEVLAPARPPEPVTGAVSPLRLPTLGGGRFDLSAESRPAIVHFFATWCPPCRAELPALARFAARTPGLAVVVVDVAEGEARLRRFLATTPGLDGLAAAPVLLDLDRAAARAWGVSLLPATFVVADGRLAFALEGEVAWDDAETSRRLASLPDAAAEPRAARGPINQDPPEER